MIHDEITLDDWINGRRGALQSHQTDKGCDQRHNLLKLREQRLVDAMVERMDVVEQLLLAGLRRLGLGVDSIVAGVVPFEVLGDMVVTLAAGAQRLLRAHDLLLLGFLRLHGRHNLGDLRRHGERLGGRV